MENSSSGFFLCTLAALAVAGGATAVLALNLAASERPKTHNDRGAPHCCCCKATDRANLQQPINTESPKSHQTRQSDRQNTVSGQQSKEKNEQNRIKDEGIYYEPARDLTAGFPELLEGAETTESDSQQRQAPSDTPSIDLRTPEKQAKRADASLGGMSPIQPGKPDPEDPIKRRGYLSWDDYFMAVAFLSAQRSKDPNRQVGACIVSQERIILGIGYNGFPRGCSDDQLPWAKSSKDGDPLKTKYPYVCHAELNAILNRNHASAAGQKMYVTMFPCNECAKLIIQSGISEVIYYTDKGGHERDIGPSDPKPEVAYAASKRLLKMAGVKLLQHRPAKTSITLDFR